MQTGPEKPKLKRRPARSPLARAIDMYRAAVGQRGLASGPRLAYEFLLRSPAGQTICMRLAGGRAQMLDYDIELPPGIGAHRLRIRVGIPKLSPAPLYEFSEHPRRPDGQGSSTVIATTKGGFVISQDLGTTWHAVRPHGYAGHEFLHVKTMGQGEYLAQAVLPEWKRGVRYVDTLVLNRAGEVLAANRIAGSPWHGCRAVDMAGETLMFAEYPYEAATMARQPCRVFRSRDRGRSWRIVFEQPPTAIRHFHFLQGRPGHAGEWWLSSGDEAEESRIWVSKDDGDSWTDVSDISAHTVILGDAHYSRSVFRLTDIVWLDDEAIWGTDHYMPGLGGTPRGGKVLRARTQRPLAPRLVGTARWPIRSIVDVGEFWILFTQGPLNLGAAPEERRPAVYLMPKEPRSGAPELVHLLDVEAYSPIPTGFTYSKASRVACDGVFFTSRSGTDVLPFGHKLLKWEVTFA